MDATPARTEFADQSHTRTSISIDRHFPRDPPTATSPADFKEDLPHRMGIDCSPVG